VFNVVFFSQGTLVKFYKRYTELAKDFLPNFPGNLAVNLTTIRNFNTKANSTPCPSPTHNPLMRHREVHKTVARMSPS